METKPTFPWLAYILCVISYLFAGSASTLISSYLPVAIEEMLHEKPSEARLGEIGAYINAISLYGWMIGGFLFGYTSDKFGRKYSLVVSTALYGITTVGIYFASGWQTILLLRFLTGMGIGGVLLVTTIYISEVWPAKTRPVMLGILAVAFPAGIVATGIITVGISNWKNAFLLGLIPLVSAIFIWAGVKESGDWQTENKNNTDRHPSFTTTHSVSLVNGSIVFGAVLIGLWGIFSWMPTWVQSILPQGQDGKTERGITMMLLGMGGILGGIVSGFLIRKIGTRNTLILTFSGLVLMSLLLFISNRQFSNIVYAETALLAFFFGISQGALSSYIPALFPTRIRARASGFCFNIGRFFTATAVFFVGAMVSFFGGFGNALLSFSGMFIIALIAMIFFQDPLKSSSHGIH